MIEFATGVVLRSLSIRFQARRIYQERDRERQSERKKETRENEREKKKERKKEKEKKRYRIHKRINRYAGINTNKICSLSISLSLSLINIYIYILFLSLSDSLSLSLSLSYILGVFNLCLHQVSECILHFRLPKFEEYLYLLSHR